MRLAYIRAKSNARTRYHIIPEPLRPTRFLLVKRSFHKFYFRLEERFARISHQVSILDPWLESVQIQRLLTYLLLKANRFILTIDEWIEEKLLE